MSGTGLGWVVHALFVDPDPDRLRGLARAAPDATGGWDGVAEALALHGILPLVRRNLLAAGVAIPSGVDAVLAAREAALREDARRDLLTLERFLDAAHARSVPVVLLKGADLALDLYPDAALRYKQDLDVLVARGRVRAALRAAADAGFLMDDRQLPVWWYRLVHVHVALRPAVSLMKPLEIHWRLHSPALLYTASSADVHRRLREVRAGPHRAWGLDPLDRFLHLATHLARHAGHELAQDGAGWLVAQLESPEPVAYLQWVVDLAGCAERLAGSIASEQLIRRTKEWNAEAALERVLAPVAACPLSRSTREWVDRVRGGLRPAGPRVRTRGARRGRARGPHPVLQLRLSQLGLLPRWVWPPADYFRRRLSVGRSGLGDRLRLGAARLAHAAAVLAHAGLAGAALPIALAGRRCLRAARRRSREAAFQPERLMEVASAWERTAGRSAASRTAP